MTRNQYPCLSGYFKQYLISWIPSIQENKSLQKSISFESEVFASSLSIMAFCFLFFFFCLPTKPTIRKPTLLQCNRGKNSWSKQIILFILVLFFHMEGSTSSCIFIRNLRMLFQTNMSKFFSSNERGMWTFFELQRWYS